MISRFVLCIYVLPLNVGNGILDLFRHQARTIGKAPSNQAPIPDPDYGPSIVRHGITTIQNLRSYYLHVNRLTVSRSICLKNRHVQIWCLTIDQTLRGRDKSTFQFSENKFPKEVYGPICGEKWKFEMNYFDNTV